ncbi:2-amino-4-hydroxy-6-hydroxymethyldihydropteridine diphosphokinase [Rhizobium sp. FKL33]|uniref:2-amino-4-hydroxy-6- hydroxymethyldihydropteridine diphosphokinase n=1 Tax=Rhizobium sp. FKL33 TaxID=2562307 RepID=UPI0010C0B606|nr:2-amino-4-hydroxy-6-hydroxymethyldihydropteridine diphosphokinase [Rhizobium sp. FKL33]
MPNAETVAYLGLGGNLGDPVANMAAALQQVEARQDCRVTAVSRLYRTPPWGKTDQDWFFNSAAEISTTLDPLSLLRLCLEIERSMKRIRIERWGPRTIDLDVLAYGDVALASEELTLPHPRMTERAFVLLPLADLAPDLVVAERPISAWLADVDAAGIEVADADRGWWRRV